MYRYMYILFEFFNVPGTVGILISFLKVIIDTICKIYNNISNYRVLFCPVKHRVLIKTSYQKMINKPIEKEQTNTEK